MTLIRPSFVENLYTTLFSLEPDRPMYYMFVTRLARSIFISLGFDGSNEQMEDKVTIMGNLIKEIVEVPLEATFTQIIHAYYNPRFMYSKKAFTYIGEGVDQREVSRYEIMMRLEYIKDWVYDEIIALSPYIRFTKPQQMLT
jgi:hypothetical protein